MKLSYPSKVLLALLCTSASVSLSAQKPVYLPVPSERLVQALEYIYFALDDGNTSGERQTWFLYANSGETSKAGALTTSPELQGNYAIHFCQYLTYYGCYRFPDVGHNSYKHLLGPTASAQAAYNAGNTDATSPGSYLVLRQLESSTPTAAHFTISTYSTLGGNTYYLSRTNRSVKWYTAAPVDQIAAKSAVSSTENAGAWTVYITPESRADGVTTSFHTGEHGNINGQTLYQRSNVTGIPWPAVSSDDGWMFNGWYDNPDLTGDEYIRTRSVSGYFVPDAVTHLYAHYLPESDMPVLAWQTDGVQVLYTGNAVSYSIATPDGPEGSRMTLASCEVDRAVYELSVPDSLLSRAGTQVLVRLFGDDGMLMGFKRLTVPAYVTTGASHVDYTDEIVILSGGVLTLSQDLTCRNLSVYGNGKLVVPEGVSLTVNGNLILRGGEYTHRTYRFCYPQMVVKGAVFTPDNRICYDYLISNRQYYALSLPYAVPFSDITYADGTPAEFGLQHYNGERRARHDTGWEDVTSGTLLAGKGYTVYAMPKQVLGDWQQYAVLRFPMHPDLSQGETGALGLDYRKVPVTPYGAGESDILPNEAGWNLVGNPYLASFSGIQGLDGNNGIGILALSDQGYTWQGTLRYIVMPNTDGTVYLPQQVNRAELGTFQNFFVQIGQGDSLCFPYAGRAQQSPMRWEAAADENGNEEELLTGITLSGQQQIDYVGLLFAPAYTTGFDYNADLGKMQNRSLNLYALSGQQHLSYMALPEPQVIPLGYTITDPGSYTFRFDASRYDPDRLEALYLTDRQLNRTVNLLLEDYTFTSGTASSDTRFVLETVSARHTPTNLQSVQSDRQGTYKWLHDGHIIIMRGAARYSLLGIQF